jgi:dTDP-4-amino-4,6-dideoxygalactose transaminase
MADIIAVAKKSGLKVVEDCAQAFGTLIRGRLVGTFGDACCYSLQQSKHITCGEGGIFATSNAEAYGRAVLYSNSGIPSFRFGVPAPQEDFDSPARGHLQFGHNHRISELQAAVALAQLSRINDFIRRRAELVDLINTELRRKSNSSVRVPPIFHDCTISYWRYPVLVPPGRGSIREVSYLVPAFQQMSNRRLTPFGMPIPQYVNYERGTCPNAEKGASQVRAILVHHDMTDQQMHNVVEECLGDL